MKTSQAGYVRMAAIAAVLMLTAVTVPRFAAAQQVDASSPSALIDTAAKAMLQDLDAHRAEYKQDPKKVYVLVDKFLLPHFDTTYAGQLVLGTAWRNATPDQRQRFVAAFYRAMLNNYGDALVDFTADRLTVLPWRGDAAAARATVRSTVRRDNGSTVDVRYEMRKVGAEWKVFDVVIDGISYVAALRGDFSAEIAQKGLDAVIQRLETHGPPPSISGKTAPAK